MEYLHEWLMLVAVFGMAVVSPGPDFVMAVRNSVVYSRRAGLFTALGFALGVCVHVFYTVIGIAALMAQSTLMFTVIKYIGAAYLIYIGTKAILSKGDPSHLEEGEPNPNTAAVAAPAKCMSALAALRSGFITNLFNPKATLFFLAMFTQIIGPETPVHVQIFFGMTCALICAGWFSAVALVLTKPRVKKVFLRIAKWIDRVCGGLMIALGLKLAVAR